MNLLILCEPVSLRRVHPKSVSLVKSSSPMYESLALCELKESSSHV